MASTRTRLSDEQARRLEGYVSADDDWLICERCGTPLGDDPDDDPTGAPGGFPLCGECERNRNFEADLAALDAQDGSIDGTLDW